MFSMAVFFSLFPMLWDHLSHHYLVPNVVSPAAASCALSKTSATNSLLSLVHWTSTIADTFHSAILLRNSLPLSCLFRNARECQILHSLFLSTMSKELQFLFSSCLQQMSPMVGFKWNFSICCMNLKLILHILHRNRISAAFILFSDHRCLDTTEMGHILLISFDV